MTDEPKPKVGRPEGRGAYFRIYFDHDEDSYLQKAIKYRKQVKAVIKAALDLVAHVDVVEPEKEDDRNNGEITRDR